MQRQEIEIDGKVWETCTLKEFSDADQEGFSTSHAIDPLYFRLKKAEPRVWEGKVVPFGLGRVVPIPNDWPEGTPVIVTEKLP